MMLVVKEWEGKELFATLIDCKGSVLLVIKEWGGKE